MSAPSRCPKCQAEAHPEELACRRCGLVVKYWADYAGRAGMPIEPLLDAPWAELAAAWDDDAAHARFLERAAAADALDLAAAHYRRRRDQAPDDARARAGLERAVILAQQIYQARARAERPPRALATIKILGTLAAGMLLGSTIWILLRVLLHRGH